MASITIKTQPRLCGAPSSLNAFKHNTTEERNHRHPDWRDTRPVDGAHGSTAPSLWQPAVRHSSRLLSDLCNAVASSLRLPGNSGGESTAELFSVTAGPITQSARAPRCEESLRSTCTIKQSTDAAARTDSLTTLLNAKGVVKKRRGVLLWQTSLSQPVTGSLPSPKMMTLLPPRLLLLSWCSHCSGSCIWITNS